MSFQNVLLGLLAQQPRHGYELHDAFEAMVGGEETWDVKPAQVYNTLARLEKGAYITENRVTQEGGPRKRIYEITAEGRQALAKWFATPVPSEHQRDEFYLKLMLCLATGEGDPYRVIYVQRASLYKELHRISNRHSQADPASQLALILLLEQVMMRLEADLRWLDMVEARLDDIRRQPLPEPETRRRGRPPAA